MDVKKQIRWMVDDCLRVAKPMRDFERKEFFFGVVTGIGELCGEHYRLLRQPEQLGQAEGAKQPEQAEGTKVSNKNKK